MMKRPFRDFDLPTQHLATTEHYVPPRARSTEEIERRRTRPTGALLAEHQVRGLEIAAHMLERAEDKPNVQFASSVLAASALNTAWYSFARGSNVMRRRLRLPVLPVATLETHLETPNLKMEAVGEFKEAALAAKGILHAIEARSPKLEARKALVGRMVGRASLTLASAQLGETPFYTTPFVAQTKAREQGLIALDRARSMTEEIGTPPSLAQLPDPDSDLSVYIRRAAPDGVYQAFEEAVETYRIPR